MSGETDQRRAIFTDSFTVVVWCPGCNALHEYDPKVFAVAGTPEAPSIPATVVVVRFDRPAFQCVSKLVNGFFLYGPESTHRFAGTATPAPLRTEWNQCKQTSLN